jgi:hypothetical protein
MCDAAEPGEWRVRGGAIERYSGGVVNSVGSVAFMAYARSAIPRLIRGARALEESLRSSWNSASIFRRELMDEREAHQVTAKNASAGKTGPEGEIAMLAEAASLGAIDSAYLESSLRRWAGGASVVEGLRCSIESVNEARARRATFDKEWQNKIDAEIDRLRQVERDYRAHRCTPKKTKPIKAVVAEANDKGEPA